MQVSVGFMVLSWYCMNLLMLVLMASLQIAIAAKNDVACCRHLVASECMNVLCPVDWSWAQVV